MCRNTRTVSSYPGQIWTNLMDKTELIAARLFACMWLWSYVIYNANVKQAHEVLILHFLNQLLGTWDGIIKHAYNYSS